MRFAAHSIGIGQRSFWLRCFLGRALCVALFNLALCATSHAQLDIPKPIRLGHVEGYVANSYGKPVVNAQVTLTRDGKVAFSARTDSAGEFRFDHVSGHYTFRVERTENAPATREVVVTDEIVSYLERRKLYVLVGPGACADECSSVFTSKSGFEKALRKMPNAQVK